MNYNFYLYGQNYKKEKVKVNAKFEIYV